MSAPTPSMPSASSDSWHAVAKCWRWTSQNERPICSGRRLNCGRDALSSSSRTGIRARIEAGRLDELRLEAEEAQVDAALQAGHHRDVLARAQSLADEAPLRERRWELLARAQYQAGRQTDALRTIHRVRRLLVEELGLDPSPSLEGLEQAILRQDPTLSVEEPMGSTDGACPYQGLTPYDVNDAEGFFGREDAVAASLDRLRDVGVLAVVGPSGSGKSSLIRAGVAAALSRDGRRVVVIAPGAHPLDAMSSLPRTRAGFVLVVDQLEEVFSLCADPVERDRFLLALTEHARSGSLVVSLRADHLGHLSAHPDFAKAVEPGLYLLSGMSEDQLRAAIEGPAHQAGLVVEPGLVDLLIREVKDEPGALPLLSHVLRETWLRREGRTLTVAGYQASGGVRQAVAQSAEAVFQSVGAERQPALRDLLLRLIAPSSSGAPVRTRMPRRLVTADGHQDELIDLLVASRLVTSDDEVVEIAHEALARAWPRLRSLARRRHRGPAPAAPLVGVGRRLGLPGTSGQRAVPRNEADPGPGVAHVGVGGADTHRTRFSRRGPPPGGARGT